MSRNAKMDGVFPVHLSFISHQNNPVILPFSSTSIFPAAGTLGKPGMAAHGTSPAGTPVI